MKKVSLNGKSYVCPFAKLFREHTAAEFAALKTSIGNFWVQNPVVVFTSPTHGASLLDGIGRIEAAHEVDPDREIPTDDRGNMTDLAAKALVLDLNALARRQLTADDIRAFREEQLAIVKQMTARGASVREMVRETGLPRNTAARWARGEMPRELQVPSGTSAGENDEYADEPPPTPRPSFPQVKDDRPAPRISFKPGGVDAMLTVLKRRVERYLRSYDDFVAELLELFDGPEAERDELLRRAKAAGMPVKRGKDGWSWPAADDMRAKWAAFGGAGEGT